MPKREPTVAEIETDIAYLTPEGFHGRFTTRSLQVQGIATVITDFYRIRPVRGMWADARVSLACRALLEFSEDGTSIAQVSGYKLATAPPA